MTVVLANAAQADLEQISRWAGQEFPERGFALVEEFYRNCGGLAHFPRRYPIVEAVQGREVRKLTVRRHLIFYTIIGSDILVLRIVHGATNWAHNIELNGAAGEGKNDR